MANNWNLATKIYDALEDKGADLGNASIYIIEKVLNDHDSAQQSVQSDEAICTAQYHIMLASKGDSFCGVCHIPLRR